MPTISTHKRLIHPALRSLIRHIVFIEADFGDNPASIEGNYMPSPEQAMFINLYTRFKSRKSEEKSYNTVTSCTLIGAHITPFKLLAEESHKSVSVIFQPGGLNRFLNIPMTELFDNGYSAREVIGKEIEELLDKSHETISFDELDEIIQSYFLSKLSQVKEPLPIDLALQHLFLNYNTSIDKIAGMACMSLRNFERKCRERLGISAKLYARIARFHKAYKILETKPTIAWTDLAYKVGYFDHMHFIKDFKEFAKQTPTLVYKELREEHMQFQLDWDKL
ncbi:helix-turn-helix domain-containing protein [Flavihumibacter sp. RY-1]|uniref:Helix-turn-helix domain-containing protein n=1 Tax=Flavihumibacter fluminis TaxID=2909236 RepID=A0ABS9BJT2_9BACT|nr:helix-turn-helix domain-containing protein [Flavihumibacter fluminis]MCF1715963.1 helix-turn-helix domain-containing protein [Flavihumibacter fluminis]